MIAIKDLPLEQLRSRMRKMMRYLHYGLKSRTIIDSAIYSASPCVQYVCFDRNLNFWVSTSQNGVFKIPQPNEKLFFAAYEVLFNEARTTLEMVGAFRLIPHMPYLLQRCYQLSFLNN